MLPPLNQELLNPVTTPLGLHDNEHSATTHDHSHLPVVFGGINVDPSLNLPDLSDTRRMRYVDERKRPQVLWMLQLVCELVGCEPIKDGTDTKNGGASCSSDRKDTPCPSLPGPPALPSISTPRVVHFADIGGGRGDLANAVACFFSQPALQEKGWGAHVLVLDVNQKSLVRLNLSFYGQAGKPFLYFYCHFVLHPFHRKGSWQAPRHTSGAYQHVFHSLRRC